MPPDDDAPSQQTPSGPLPLGRNASRALVIGSILFVLAASIGGTWLILHLARQGPPPQEAVPQEQAPPDTSDTAAARKGSSYGYSLPSAGADVSGSSSGRPTVRAFGPRGALGSPRRS